MNQPAQVPHGAMTPYQEIEGGLVAMQGDLSSTLPSHIKPDTFQQVALTAIQNDPNLLNADRQSLFNSLKKAAQDGLLPDGREGALIMFKNRAQWMPMIGGVLKKIRQSGELASITAQVVHQGDQFDYWIDDDGEHLRHRPNFSDDRGPVRLVYALAKTRDGSVYIEVMTYQEVEKVRSASRSKNNGPWVTWWEQMAKKSAMHRLAKRLPLSPEIMTVVQRDESLYDFAPRQEGERDITPQAEQKPPYSDERFASNFPKWRELIQSGRKSAEAIIATVSSGATLTDDQKQKIREVQS